MGVGVTMVTSVGVGNSAFVPVGEGPAVGRKVGVGAGPAKSVGVGCGKMAILGRVAVGGRHGFILLFGFRKMAINNPPTHMEPTRKNRVPKFQMSAPIFELRFRLSFFFFSTSSSSSVKSNASMYALHCVRL